MRDPAFCNELLDPINLTWYSKSEFFLAKRSQGNPVERARRMMVRQRQSYGAIGEGWAFSAHDVCGDIATSIKRWRTGFDRIAPAIKRLSSVQIECRPWAEIMLRMDHKEALFYLDLPYLPETRVKGKYALEMSRQDHEQLVSMVLDPKGMVVLSGYDNAVYGLIWWAVDNRTYTATLIMRLLSW